MESKEQTNEGHIEAGLRHDLVNEVANDIANLHVCKISRPESIDLGTLEAEATNSLQRLSDTERTAAQDRASELFHDSVDF